jgi:signal transduction histidine kinase
MSDRGAHSSELLDVLHEIGPHAHLALIYESKEEQFAAAIPAIRIGIARRERCVYVADDNSTRDVIDALREGGIDVDAALESGSLTVATRQDTTLEGGSFVPERLLRFWTDAAEAATAAGFTGLRIVAEMTWALHGDPGAERLIEFEAKVNDLVRSHPIVGICQYNRRRFTPEAILNVIRVHPLVFFEGLVCRNPYYVPPQEFLGPHHAEMEVERLLENLRARKQAEEALKNSYAQLRSVSRRLEEAHESERRHLSRELHDQIGQALTAAKINTEMLRTAVPSESVARLNENAAILDGLLQQTRQISLDLRPPLLDDLGLIAALRWYVNQQAERARLEAKFSADPGADDVPPHIQILFFRVAQEAITNVVRHAEARRLTVELRRAESSLRLIVRDDGKGFDVAAAELHAEEGASLGLLGLKERPALAGGSVRIISSLDQGTTVEILLPLDEAENAMAVQTTMSGVN